MDLQNAVVLITGSTSGIGLALAQRFLKAGSQVIVTGRRQQLLEQIAKDNPGIHTRVCDVSLPAERVALRDWAVSTFPALNVLVNNAGIQRHLDLLQEEPWPDTQTELDTNLAAPIHLNSLFMQHLLKQAHPAIVNVTSGGQQQHRAWRGTAVGAAAASTSNSTSNNTISSGQQQQQQQGAGRGRAGALVGSSAMACRHAGSSQEFAHPLLHECAATRRVIASVSTSLPPQPPRPVLCAQDGCPRVLRHQGRPALLHPQPETPASSQAPSFQGEFVRHTHPTHNCCVQLASAVCRECLIRWGSFCLVDIRRGLQGRCPLSCPACPALYPLPRLLLLHTSQPPTHPVPAYSPPPPNHHTPTHPRWWSSSLPLSTPT